MGLAAVHSTQQTPIQWDGVAAGRFILSSDNSMDIKIWDPEDGSTASITLSAFKALYTPQLKSSNGSIYRAVAVIPHANGTFTVVSKGGVISHWTCGKVKTEAERLLHSSQVPGTLMSHAQIINVHSDGDQVSVWTSNGTYIYKESELTC